MRYYVAPGATGGARSWADVGDLVSTLNWIINNPSPDGDEIWAVGEQNVLGYRGPYDFSRVPLNINQNVAPLSIYGGFAGWENLLCERNATINSLHYPTFFQHPSILDGGNINRVVDMRNANVCRIDGFIIQNGNTRAGNDGGGAFVGNSINIWFENIVFMDNVAENFCGGMATVGVSNLMIKNTIFFNNQASRGGGLGVMDSENTLLVNLLFNDNQAVGGNAEALYLENSTDVKIINNTIAGNIGNTANSSSVLCSGSNSVGIYNSILYPDNLRVIISTNVLVDYCLLSNSIPGQNNGGFNPPPPNPLFINPVSLSAGGDYHLQPTSPCIDSGSTDYIFPFSATDLEGNPRFINKGLSTNVLIQVDMGAFEVQ